MVAFTEASRQLFIEPWVRNLGKSKTQVLKQWKGFNITVDLHTWKQSCGPRSHTHSGWFWRGRCCHESTERAGRLCVGAWGDSCAPFTPDVWSYACVPSSWALCARSVCPSSFLGRCEFARKRTSAGCPALMRPTRSCPDGAAGESDLGCEHWAMGPLPAIVCE